MLWAYVWDKIDGLQSKPKEIEAMLAGRQVQEKFLPFLAHNIDYIAKLKQW